ncbi:MAG: protoheme IX farnesyltransferase [Hyphomicrobiales bacterium]
MDNRQGARETSQAVRMFSFPGIFAQLTKFKVSLFVALSACAGFILAGERVSGEMLRTAFGVLLLSCGACALNQYQERKADAKMERTRRRPLPAGKMAPATALRVSALLAGSGSAALLLSAGWLACGLGLLAMVWYNGVYLYLKRRFVWAVLPGALVGAIPPAVGWVAAGGSLFDPRLGALGFFFFLWQVPHFLLLLMAFADDYKRAGYPCLTNRLTADQMKGIVFIWILATGTACLLIPLFLPVRLPGVLLSLLGVTLWLVGKALTLIRPTNRERNMKYFFIRLNAYALVVLFLLSLDKLLPSSDLPMGLVGKIFSVIWKSG